MTKETLITNLINAIGKENEGFLVEKTPKTSRTGPYYGVKVTRDLLDMLMFKNNKQQLTIFDFKTKTITVNKTPMPEDYFAEFVMKMEQISKDIEANKATISLEPKASATAAQS